MPDNEKAFSVATKTIDENVPANPGERKIIPSTYFFNHSLLKYLVEK